jgi:DNA-binding transcriptional ArsR family regulator
MNLDHVFGALADPTRRAILARLALGDVTVGELAEPFDMSLPAVSKHLKVLEQAGLIRKDRVAQSRHCRIEPETLKAVDAWMEDYRKLWGESLDRLEDYLKTLQAAPKEKKNARRKK